MRLDLSDIIFKRLSLTSDSDPALPGLKIFVESQIIARTLLFPISLSFFSFILSPIKGFGSTFQSPVCNTVPDGVFMLKPFGSKMEWVKVTNSISNGPISMPPEQGTSRIGIRPEEATVAGRIVQLKGNPLLVDGLGETGVVMMAQPEPRALLAAGGRPHHEQVVFTAGRERRRANPDVHGEAFGGNLRACPAAFTPACVV